MNYNTNIATIAQNYVSMFDELYSLNKSDIDNKKQIIYTSVQDALPITKIDGVKVNVIVCCGLTAYHKNGRMHSYLPSMPQGDYCVDKIFKILVSLDGILDNECDEIILHAKHEQFDNIEVNKYDYFDKIYNLIEKFIYNLNELKLTAYGEIDVISEKTNRKIKSDMIWIDIIKNVENVENEGLLQCCVCYNHTYTKTDCKHSLCYRCWTNIKDDEDDDADVKKACPMCRKCIRHKEL